MPLFDVDIAMKKQLWVKQLKKNAVVQSKILTSNQLDQLELK